MDFELSEEEKMTQECARDFAEKRLMPVASELDEKQEFPQELVAELAGLGLMIVSGFQGQKCDIKTDNQ